MKASSGSQTEIRNSLRPFFNQKKRRSYWKNIEYVRRILDTSNPQKALSIVEDNKSYPFPGLGNTFPSDYRSIPIMGLRQLPAQTESRELKIALARINFHQTKLVAALDSLNSINERLSTGEWSVEDDEFLGQHVRKYGWSLVVLKKASYARLISTGLTGLSRYIRHIAASVPRTVWAVYAHYLYDLVDPTSDPCSALQHWGRAMRYRADNREWYAPIFRQSIFGADPNSALSANTILRLNNCSLLDLTLFLWTEIGATQDETNIVKNLSPEILSSLRSKFTASEITPHSGYYDPKGNISSQELFRLSYLFSDVKMIAHWRRSMAEFLLQTMLSDENRYNAAAIENLFKSTVKCSEITNAVKRLEPWVLEWCNVGPGVVLDTDYLAAALLGLVIHKNFEALASERSQLAEMAAGLGEFAEFVSVEVLEAIVPAVPEGVVDELDFILLDTKFRRIRSRDNDLERRLALMRLVEASGATDIPSFVSKLSTSSPRAAVYIARVATRSLLERLFLLMSSLKEVLTTRIALVEWLIQFDGDNDGGLEDEVASLKRELENLDIRSDIDSTRVHVDEESLREWFWETQRSAVSRYVQTAIAEGREDAGFSVLRAYGQKERNATDDDTTEDAEVGADFLLLGILRDTLRAFARDKSFGLDAYLSRRIRHGTLSGSIMTPLTRIIRRAEESDYFEGEEGASFLQSMDDWRKATAAELDHARRNVIQLHDVSPTGLIRADFRYAANITHLDAAISRIRSRVIESRGAYDIFPDLYALCWDCLEPDLAQLRRFLLRELLPKLTEALSIAYEKSPTRPQGYERALAVELASSIQSKIHDVCGWFIRPVFRRDQYSLQMLAMSTIALVKELDASFDFEEILEVPSDLTINRATFDVMSDLLFVVIGNAAKHGARGRGIEVRSERSEGSSGPIIGLSVRSFVDTPEGHSEAVRRITEAMTVDAADLAKAAVAEGFSGLGKAVGIIRHVRSDAAGFAFYAEEEERDIRFDIFLPAGILGGTRRV